MRRDFNGSGRGEIVVSSPWGMAVLGLSGGTMASVAISQSGSALDQWRLDSTENHIGPTGRFDGDTNTSSILMRSGWGVGVLKIGANGLASTAMAGNGTAIPSTGIGGAISGSTTYTIDTSTMTFGPVGDFDGDGHDSVLVTGTFGVATLKQSIGFLGGAVALWDTILIRSIVGEWAVSPNDWFGPVGDFDGDGKEEILVVGSWGIALVRFSTDNSGTLTRVVNGSAIGGWTLDVTQDQFGPAADYDGDGKPEILIFNSTGFALLKYEGALTTLAVNKAGDWIGGWRLGGGDRLGPAADYNGDGKAEVLISSGWGIGVLSWSNGAWSASGVTSNGTACGGWRLDTAGNRMNLADDFDGDGKAELLVSSGWGMGLLDLSGTPTSKFTAPNGTALGNWRLDTTRNDLEIGTARSLAFLLFHTDWQDAVNDTEAVLTGRGTTVMEFQDPTSYLAALQGFSAVTAPGDRLLIYLGVHGNSSRNPGDTSMTPCETHGMESTNGYTTLSTMAPSFRAIANRGCDLIVVDGSCEGGETVLDATGERYCAISTTGIDVALTDTPDPGKEIALESKPAVFGMWWTPSHAIGSRLNGRILMNDASGDRIEQRLFRNDNTACTPATIFGRTALFAMNTLTPWWCDAGGCYLYPILWPAEAAKEPGPWTNTVESMLATAAGFVNPWSAVLDTYASTVLDAAYGDAQASLYAANFDAIWQCLADDPTWTPSTDLGKYDAAMGNINVGGYLGTDGYTRLLNAAYTWYFMIQASYRQMYVVLGELDTAVRNSPTLGGQAPKETNATPMKLTLGGLEPGMQLPLSAQDRVSLKDPRLQATIAGHPTSQQVRALGARAQTPSQPYPPIISKPTLASVQAMLTERLTLWTAAALSEPTGDAAVDALAAQLMGCYTEHDHASFAASFLLAVIEDVLCAGQSAGHAVPGDLVTF